MLYIIDYVLKSQTSKARQSSERMARFQMEPWKSSKALWSLASAGNRKRSKIINFDVAYNCHVGNERFSISVHQIKSFGKDDPQNAFDLAIALSAKGKKKPRNKKQTITKFASICASYPFAKAS